MSSTQFISSTHAVVPPNSIQSAVDFLLKPNTSCTEAWVLAKASTTGPIQIQLMNQQLNPVSDAMTIHTSGDVSRVKLQNVNLVSSPLPGVYRLWVTNQAATGDADVEGVLLVC